MANSSRPTWMRIFIEYAVPHRWSFLAGAICLLLTNWLTVMIPVELGKGIDSLSDTASVERAAWTIAAMGLGIIVVRTLSRVLFFNPGRDIEYRLRKDLFAHLLSLQPAFYSGKRTGDIVSRASNDITWTRAMVGFGLMQVVNTTLAIVLTGWKMIDISWQLTLYSLIPIVIALFVVQIFIKQLFTLQKRSQEQLGAISDHVLSSFQGVATIQGFGAEPAFIERLETKNDAWLRTTMRLAVIRSLAFPLLSFSGGAAVFVLLYIGAPMALNNELSVGEIAAFATLIGALLPPLRSLGWMMSVLQRGQAALERIFELMDSAIDRPEGENPVISERGKGPSIEVRNLQFAYPDDPERVVLKDLNFDMPAGAVIGVFGRTGSGKSTLLNVLARLYDPRPGMVFVDGEDINHLDRHSWRERMAVAPQRPFLFSESIAGNIGLGSDAVSEQIVSAAHKASLMTDLEALPDGIDTVVGQRGIMLSGGQRQRVALARALIRNADLVLLDDVLSAVDHGTEQLLVDSLRSAGRDRKVAPTIVIVSHRISALRHADSIIVMDEGEVSAQGTHDELLLKDGPYRDIWEVQST
ncbi:MAG: ABC transporter ATP-binding protein [Myxococcota bacterium]